MKCNSCGNEIETTEKNFNCLNCKAIYINGVFYGRKVAIDA